MAKKLRARLLSIPISQGDEITTETSDWRNKAHFRGVSTVLTQIEACLNSRPLAPLPCEGDAIEPLTPGHFLVGKPLEALPDPQESYRSIPYSNNGISGS